MWGAKTAAAHQGEMLTRPQAPHSAPLRHCLRINLRPGNPPHCGTLTGQEVW
jgi:hypothetical protein